MVRSFSCFNSSATAGLGGGSTAASLPTASSSRGTSNQSNKFDITGKQHNGLPRNRLCLHECSKLCQLYHKACRLCFKTTLRLVLRPEMTNRLVNGVTHFLVRL